MMMRSSRVRDETPQPTMRVTDGSSDLSMICREETRQHMRLRADLKNTHLFRAETSTEIHTHTHTHTQTKACAFSKPLGVRYLEEQTAPCRQTVEWHNQATAEAR